VAKPDRGKKHTCQNCGTIFYDFRRTPVDCPKCGSRVEVQLLLKPRRPGPQSKSSSRKIGVPEPAHVEEPDNLEVEIDEVEEEEDDLMEDMSDIGDDDSDMSEVKEHISSPSGEKE